MDKNVILLVEDNSDHARLTKLLLLQNRVYHEVVVARTGQEALDYLFAMGKHAGRDKSLTPELVLLDLGLPDMGGFEVLRRVQADDRTKNIPVVVITSSHSEDDLVESYRLGASSYIRKSAMQLGLSGLFMHGAVAHAEPEPQAHTA
jgi:two-component system response regulator